MRLRSLLVSVVLGLPQPLLAEAGFEVLPARFDNVDYAPLAAQIADNGTLEALAELLNSRFRLPQSVRIGMVECGEPNAFFDPESRDIRLCLELIAALDDQLRPQFADPDDLGEAAAGAFVATALHEAGHALVQVLALPITGREEDAVDQLAAWLLIDGGEPTAVLGAAATYDSNASGSTDVVGGEHSLDQQRYFNLICWVYGSAPEAFAHLIDDWRLPPSRAAQCPAEYAQLDRSWRQLLGAHLRPAAAP